METDEIRSQLDSFDRRDWQESENGAGPVRFAMVGLGWWTQDEAMPAVAESTFCVTSAVVSGSAEKAREVADEHETVERAMTYEEFQDGVGVDEYEAVYVCTPNARHLELVESALEAGKPVLCEKPMEATVERAERLVETWEATGTDAMVAYRMQTEPAVRRARDLHRAGAIGEPVHVHGDMSQSILGWGADQWRLDPDLVGYGASVMDLGIYSVNTTRFVLDRDPVAAQSMSHSDHDFFADVPDEVAAFTLAFEGGVYGACTASQNANLGSLLRVVGTEGELRIEPAFHGSSELRVTAEDGTIDVETADIDQMEAEFDYFADRLLAGREPHPDPGHGLLDMQALAAIYEAGETGETVEIRADRSS